KNVHRLLPALAEAIEDYHRRVPTRKVNEVVMAAQAAQPAPHGARVLYATQGAVDPPTFTLFANRELPPTYLRYLERRLREAFDLGARPLKIRVRRRSSCPCRPPRAPPRLAARSRRCSPVRSARRPRRSRKRQCSASSSTTSPDARSTSDSSALPSSRRPR